MPTKDQLNVNPQPTGTLGWRDPLIHDYVHEKLKEQWTPELIAGRLEQEHPGYSISHEAVYQYIYEDAPELKKHLPRSHRVRRKRTASRINSVNRIPLESRH